jgi:hypothetical protein
MFYDLINILPLKLSKLNNQNIFYNPSTVSILYKISTLSYFPHLLFIISYEIEISIDYI